MKSPPVPRCRTWNVARASPCTARYTGAFAMPSSRACWRRATGWRRRAVWPASWAWRAARWTWPTASSWARATSGQGPGRHRVAAPAGRGADAPPAAQAAMAPAPGVAAMHGFDAAPPPFQLGMPALDAFPRKQWLRLAARRLRALSPADMAYGDPAGYWPCGRRSRPICRFRAARLVNRGRSSSRRAIGPVWHCWRARCWRPAIRSGWKNRVSRRLARFWSVTAAVSCRCRSMAKV